MAESGMRRELQSFPPMKTKPSRIVSRLLVAVSLATVALGRLAAAEAMPMKSELLPAYVKIADALAADDLTAAKAAAATFAEQADVVNQFPMAKQADAVAKAADLATARDAFKTLSLSVELLAVGEQRYVVMTCAMAKADWVQTSTEVKNPYLGKSMRSCGEPKNNDSAPKHGCGDAAPGAGHDGHAQPGCGE